MTIYMKFCTMFAFGELIFTEIDTNAFDMNIHIDTEYQGKGWSRVLFQKHIEYGIQQRHLTLDTILAIDADASGGFWDHIGLQTNRYGYDYKGHRNLCARGYEKITTVRELMTTKFYTKN